MKKFGRITFVIILVLIIITLVGTYLLNRIQSKSLPDYNQNIPLANINHNIEVYRDSLGIPHVYAKNEKDLYTAVGYLMAQDRLWQMDLLRRATTGKLAEIFGEGFIETDVLMRSLRITDKSKRVLKNSSPEIILALESFSNGVNQYIENNTDKLPPEFTILQYTPEKWKPIHSINLIGYMAWDLTMPWGYEMALHKMKKKLTKQQYQELVPGIRNQKTLVFPEFEEDSVVGNLMENLLTHNEKLENLGLKVFTGSNNWAVSGKKSTTGKPILANDMHLGLFSPGIWYQMHQTAENGVNVTGLVLPGQPFVICGHNDTIAWGMTNVMLDDMDFYNETIHPEDSTKYKLNSQWENLEIVTEQIPVKGNDTATRTIAFTHRGPIISDFKDMKTQNISMRWIGNEFSNELRTVYHLNRAASWADFKKAAVTFVSISQNIVYADIHGNIGLYCCAGIPIREGNGISLYPGDTTQYDWKGMVPFEQLPHSYNPESGFVASANNKTAGNDYPYYISHWFDLPARINRIRELLKEKDQLSVNDFKAIQTDHTSDMARRIKPILVNELEKKVNQLSELEKNALKKLKSWNGTYNKNEVSPLIFEQFYINLAKNIAKDELGDSLLQTFMGKRILVRNLVDLSLEGNSSWTDDTQTPNKKETISEMIVTSFHQTMNQLQEKNTHNIENWTWGSVHTLTLKHPLSEKKILDKLFNLNKGPFAVGGSYHTVSPYSYSYNKPYEVNHGASHRHVYNLNDWDQSWTVIPTGTSGIPVSLHYCDQTEMYIQNNYHKDYTDRDLVEKNKKYHMTFTKK